MAETQENTIGRILDFQPSNPDELISSFKRRIEEQIAVVRIGIQNKSVNDAKISENYAKKAERFLGIQYFCDKKNLKKRVRDLKKVLKQKVAYDKELISIIEEWIIQKRKNKIIAAEKFTPIRAQNDFSYYDEMCSYYCFDMDFLNTCETKYTSERIIINRLLGLLSDENVVSGLFHFKNSWKVETLKKALQDNRKGLTNITDDEFTEMMALPYFRYKKYLTMECDEFKELLSIRSAVLMGIEGWIKDQYYDACRSREHLHEITVINVMKANVTDLFNEYDEFLSVWDRTKKEYEREYSLYRFGQGLIESDIFDALFK